MGATFNRIKTWINETLTAGDVNAEFDNILTNLTPAGIDDASANVAAMQVQTDPGELSSESLALSLKEEIERLRFSVAELKGTTYWYTSPVATLASLNTAFGAGGLAPSRLVSGAATGNSSQSVLLVPEGAGNGNNLVIKGSVTDLVYFVDASQFTLDSDITIASTTAAPVANNTALVNDASLNDQAWTKWTGMYGGAIPIDSIGSEITSRNDLLTAFRLTTGAGSEYFLGTPDTTNNQIKDIKRGWFFDESGAPVESIVFADNDTITLMRIAWVFLENDNTANITYNEPNVSSIEPGSPTNGDFWYDLAAQTWKTFDGANFVASNCAFVGISIQDENGDCVAARSEDFVKTYIPGNTIELDYVSATQVQTNRGARVGVYGTTLQFGIDQLIWDITTDLDTGSEAASTMYFFYVTEDGTPKISIQAPEDMTNSRGGYYHPHETWRCVGQAWNDSSSDLGKVISYHTDDAGVAMASSSVAANALTLEYWTSPLVKYKLYDEDDDTNAKPKFVRFPIYQAITVPSGATLGHLSSPVAVGANLATDDNVVLHVVTKANYPVLGVSSHQQGQGTLVSSTALSTSSDVGALYTATAYTDAQVRAVAYGNSLQTTAGTWAANLQHFKALPHLNVCRRLATTSAVSLATTSTSPVAATNSTLIFQVTGKRKLHLSLCSFNTGGSELSATSTVNTTVVGTFYFYAGGTVRRAYTLSATAAPGSGSTTIKAPPSSMSELFYENELTVGSISFDIRGDALTTSATTTISGGRFVIEELPYDGDF